ncbi:MAG: cytoplasmic iron level regulating protein YaaA (DUF328/UPF0246 family) [Candidatus Endobugula sp.]|jgi:cytoplasmic iron level regulating protein YaaA (DUF328/UPF0246 family)
MLLVLSPAKTLDFETPCSAESSYPRFQKEAIELIGALNEKTPEQIQELMDLSENLAELNVARYRNFKKSKSPQGAKQAIYAFKGDVYVGLEVEELDNQDLLFAQAHVRILSGLYGLLRPLDLIQPYRLEMGTRLAFDDYTTLYNYWADTIAEQMNRDLKSQGDQVLINLASNEYFKALARPALKAKVVNIDFRDFKNDKYKVISFFAKKARGMMAQYIVKNRINEVESLKAFDYQGYYFDEAGSDETNLLFKRG